MKHILWVAALAGLLNAESSLRHPMLGFAPAPSFSGLRPVWGTFGADTLDDPIGLPSGINTIMAAPRLQYALAVRGDQGELGIVLLSEANGAGAFQSIDGALSNADRMAFSPDGSAAIVSSSKSNRLQVLTGLPGAPRIARDLDGSTLPGAVVALAVSDDGAGFLVGSSLLSVSTVSTFGADGGANTIFTATSVAAIRFLPGAHDAVIVDGQANQVTLLSGSAYSPRVLAGNSQGVSTPLDVETSTDGHLIYIANSGAQNILTIDMTSGNLTVLPCGFAPAAFGRLFKSVVSVTAQDGNDVWLLDTDAASPWVAYAPRAR